MPANQRDDRTDDERRGADPRDRPHYAKVTLRCPICGTSDLDHSGGVEAPAVDVCYASAFCDYCGTALSIEYTPTDVLFLRDRDDGGEWLSGVSDGVAEYVYPQYVAYDSETDAEGNDA